MLWWIGGYIVIGLVTIAFFALCDSAFGDEKKHTTEERHNAILFIGAFWPIGWLAFLALGAAQWSAALGKRYKRRTDAKSADESA